MWRLPNEHLFLDGKIDLLCKHFQKLLRFTYLICKTFKWQILKRWAYQNMRTTGIGSFNITKYNFPRRIFCWVSFSHGPTSILGPHLSMCQHYYFSNFTLSLSLYLATLPDGLTTCGRVKPNICQSHFWGIQVKCCPKNISLYLCKENTLVNARWHCQCIE